MERRVGDGMLGEHVVNLDLAHHLPGLDLLHRHQPSQTPLDLRVEEGAE
jgi:hypothetical protein